MRRRTLVCSFIVALAFIGLSATRASAQVAGNPFDIDGTITDFINSGESTGLTVPPCDPPATGADPNSGPAPQACKQNDPNGNTQELGPINSDSTKIGVIHNAHLKTSGKVQGVSCTVVNPCLVSMLGTTNPNAQVDLNAAWVQSKTALVNNVPHVFLYFAWRRDSENGSGFISLEIQQSQAGGPLDNCEYEDPAFDPDDCNPWAGRQDGDIIFLWDQQGGSTTILAAPISGPAGFNQTLTIPDCSHSECDDLSAANVAEATFGTDCGTGFVAGQCGEMVVDLTALGIFPTTPTECVGIANFIPGTVTGNSNTADYKDVILAPFPPISNCGSVSVTKVTVAPDGTTLFVDASTIFGYTIARSGNVALRFANDAADHPEDGAAPQIAIVRPNLLAAPNTRPGLLGCQNATAPCGGIVQTHTDLIAGTNYTLVEKTPIPQPYSLLSIVCTVDSSTFTITAGGTFDVRIDKTTACVITNQLQLGSPTATSVQRAKVADSIKIVNITPGGSNNAAPALAANQVVISLFTDAACTTLYVPDSGQSNPQTLTLDLSDDPNNTGKKMRASSFTTDQSVHFNNQLYWGFKWDGDTFNNPLTVAQTCTSPGENVTITFVPAQVQVP